jgi:hypothetical protein
MTTPTPDRAEQAVRDILTAAGYPQLADEGAGPEWRIVTPGWHVFTYHGKVRVDWWSDGTLSANPSCWAADSACLAALRPALEAAGLTVWAPDGSVLEIAPVCLCLWGGRTALGHTNPACPLYDSTRKDTP